MLECMNLLYLMKPGPRASARLPAQTSLSRAMLAESDPSRLSATTGGKERKEVRVLRRAGREGRRSQILFV